MNYYFEFEGGLGDIIHVCFERGEYRRLTTLGENDYARITIFCVNPHANELFAWHPNHSRFAITQLPHWGPHDEYPEKRRTHNLPPRSAIDRLPRTTARVEFHPAPRDLPVLSDWQGRDYVVIAPSAGMPDRIIPAHLVAEIALCLAKMGWWVLGIGRNYADQRGGARFEPALPDHEHCVSLIDQLTVAGTAALVAGSAGVVCSHSSISLLGWHLNLPQLLLYPRSVHQRCFVEKRDGHTIFGADRTNTRRACFDEFSTRLTEEFSQLVHHHSVVRELPAVHSR